MEGKLLGLDLFSGIGGITLALQEWIIPIAYCENDRYAQGVLLSRMSEAQLPIAPIWDDVRTLKGDMLPIKPEIIYGGSPCQDISSAGLKKGLEGERSGLFFEIVRLVDEIRPYFIFLENVSAITIRGLDVVCREFTKLGYDSRWGIISAREVGAPHKRERWFLLCTNSDSNRCNSRENNREKRILSSDQKQDCAKISWEKTSTQSDCIFREMGEIFSEKRDVHLGASRSSISDNFWRIEPDMDRVVDGLQFRVDRVKGLGNSVVPQQVKEAFKRLMGIKNV